MKKIGPFYDNRFRGLYSDERADLPEGFLRELKNCYIENGRIRGRPGVTQLSDPLTDVGAPESRIQGVHQFAEKDGTKHTIAIVDGDLYEYDWSAGDWTFWDIQAAVSVSSIFPVRMVTFNGALIVTDGVNKPWMWNGLYGALGNMFVELSDAPVCRHLAVYYQKLFCVDQVNEPNVISWSDEGDATSGYGADQQWQFGQTDQGRIHGAVGLNEALLIFKQDSSSRIQGAVDDNFQTEAVREGISTTEGTISGDSLVVVDEDVYLLSQNGPRLISQGSKPIDLAQGPAGGDMLHDLWAELTEGGTLIENAQGAYDPRRRHVMWTIAVGSSAITLVYSIEDASWQVFEWSGFVPSGTHDTVEDNDGVEYVAMGSTTAQIMLYGDDDVNSDEGETIDRLIQTRDYGGESDFVRKLFRYIDIGIYPQTGEATVNITPITDGTRDGRTREITIDGTSQERFTRGIRDFGGRMRVKIQQQVADQNFDLMDLFVRATAYSAEHQGSGQT